MNLKLHRVYHCINTMIQCSLKITDHYPFFHFSEKYLKDSCITNCAAEFAICIFIDFRKGFGTIEHNILLEQLYRLGIRDNYLQWPNSHLSNRYQHVNYNHTSSDMKLITWG